jgi:hypothetical protein
MDDEDALGEGGPFEDDPALFEYLFGPERPAAEPSSDGAQTAPKVA